MPPRRLVWSWLASIAVLAFASSCGSAARPSPPGQAAVSAEQRLRRFEQCTAWFNARDRDQLQTCFAGAAHVVQVDALEPVEARGPGQISDKLVAPLFAAWTDLRLAPQLTMVKDRKLFSLFIARASGRTGAAQPRPIALWGALMAELTDAGDLASVQVVFDERTLAGQLGAAVGPHRTHEQVEDWSQPVAVIATGDRVEAANEATAANIISRFNAHDFAALVENMHPEVTYLPTSSPTMVNGREGLLAYFRDVVSRIPDVHLEPRDAWTAGAYALQILDFSGTPARRFEVLEIVVFELRDGKVAQMWGVFDDAQRQKQLSVPR